MSTPTTPKLHPVPPLNSVAVYCSASSAIEAHFAEAARTVGQILGSSRLQMVFGGGVDDG